MWETVVLYVDLWSREHRGHGCSCNLPPRRDDDIPQNVRRELMDVSVANPGVSYYYLCHVYRRGSGDAIVSAFKKTLAEVNDDVQGLR